MPALLSAVVASIVLGIVGMHALNTHGVMGTTDPASTTSPVTSLTRGAHGDMSAGSVPGHAAGAHAGMSSTAPAGGDGHILGSMVMLCFAMLAAAAGALLLLFLGLRRRPRVWAHRLTVPTAGTRQVTARLDTGPPYV